MSRGSSQRPAPNVNVGAALHEPALSRVIVELIGGETPVTEAGARLVSS